jgi:hypothetical protein
MLHYAPDGMRPEDFALGGPDWAVAWDGKELRNNILLLNLLATSRKIAKSNAAPKQDSRIAFHPEQVSGLCASA